MKRENGPKDPLAEMSAAEGKSSRKRELSREKGSAGADNKAKGWFLTYPKCSLSKELVLKILDETLGTQKLKIEEYVICEEKHKDETGHLHAFIKLDKRVRFKSDRFDLKDLDDTYHGHYEVAKSWKAVQQYVKKDGNFISNINVETLQGKHKSKLTEEDLKKPALEVLREGKITPMQISQFLKNQNTYRLLVQQEESSKLIVQDLPKQRHHWTYGESNTGKTYELRHKIAEKPEDWFQIPPNNDWTGYNNQQNLWIDEYRGQLSIQDLNRICDGGAKVNTKGGTTILHPGSTVWICSNFSIEGCYKKAEKVLIDSLKNRFIVEHKNTFFWPIEYGKKHFPTYEEKLLQRKREEEANKSSDDEDAKKKEKKITLIEI